MPLREAACEVVKFCADDLRIPAEKRHDMLLEKPLRVCMEDDTDWITLDTNRAYKLQRCFLMASNVEHTSAVGASGVEEKEGREGDDAVMLLLPPPPHSPRS